MGQETELHPVVRQLVDRLLTTEGVGWAEAKTVGGKHFIALRDLERKEIIVHEVTAIQTFRAKMTVSPIVIPNSKPIYPNNGG